MNPEPKTQNPKPKTPNPKPETLNRLPSAYRPATLSDFHFQGKPKAGMKFIIKQLQHEIYEQYTVRPTLKAKDIKPFIDAGRCWVMG